MSADGGLSQFWGDGEHRFRFAIGQFRELQENVNKRRVAVGAPVTGPMALLNALRCNDVWPDDVRDILRLGLVGGGMEPAEAHRLLKHYFDDFERYPLLSNMRPAFMVLLAGLTGVPDEDDGSKKKTTSQRMSQSPSDGSTEQARP